MILQYEINIHEKVCTEGFYLSFNKTKQQKKKRNNDRNNNNINKQTTITITITIANEHGGKADCNYSRDLKFSFHNVQK